MPLRRVGRRVYKGALPAAGRDRPALEYYVEAAAGAGRLVWPATAPDVCQTVVVADLGDR